MFVTLYFYCTYHWLLLNSQYTLISFSYTDISTLTFDPETAHPLLTLSAERTSVIFREDKVVPKENPEDRNPKRFHYYYSVMGSEGFTYGSHYWEVEVKGKTAWRVGVAREDVHRGEMDSSSTLNGLWTLCLKNGSITACTHPKPTQVLLYALPIRIGIFLDCDNKEVSFYNAVTMKPLFSFYMGTVLLPIYPFYNPCDSDEGKNCAPLSIFHPSLWGFDIRDRCLFFPPTADTVWNDEFLSPHSVCIPRAVLLSSFVWINCLSYNKQWHERVNSDNKLK